MLKKLLIATSISALLSVQALACTGVYIGKQLTTDGSTIFGRTEDLEPSHNKTFVVFPAKTNRAGDVLIDESTGFRFALPKHSYKYTAVPDVTPEEGVYHETGINEHGVIADMTVSAGTLDAVLEVDPWVDDGITESIMPTVVLAHSKTARGGIELLASIIDKQGAGEGNTLIIADQDETWYMEIVSGHQYVAVKFPEDKFAVFPNSYFLEDVDVTDTANVIASPDIKRIAEQAGTLKQKDGKILVAASYATPISDGVRSRYWAGVNALDSSSDIRLDTKAFPFLHSTSQKISVADVMALQRNRLEGTGYVPSDTKSSATGKDFQSQQDDKGLYPIGNINTMEAHIFQVFDTLPEQTPAVMWLSMGSPLVSPYLPFYGNITDTSDTYKVDTTAYDSASYYWTTDNLLGHMLKDEAKLKQPIRQSLLKIEQQHLKEQPQVIQTLSKKYQTSPKLADRWITHKTMQASNEAYEHLKYLEAKYATQNPK